MPSFSKITTITEDYVMHTKKKYGFMKFMVDVALTIVTGGLWLIWIFVREMRRR